MGASMLAKPFSLSWTGANKRTRGQIVTYLICFIVSKPSGL